MLYFTIIFILVVLFLIIFIAYNFKKNQTNKKQEIDINYEDIDSLNVSKIIKSANDIDFFRNSFWYQYEHRKILNRSIFNSLKNHFETTNAIKVSDFATANESSDADIKQTSNLVQTIISDINSKEEIARAFYKLEKIIK